MNEKIYVRIVLSVTCTIPLFIWLLTWWLPSEYYIEDPVYSYWMEQKDYVMGDGDRREILLLGDSRIKSDLVSSELGDDTYNVALPGGRPIEMYYTLQNYIVHHPTPKAVFVSFAPVHFYVMETYLKFTQYYRYFDDATIDQINRVIKEHGGKDYASETRDYRYRLPNIYMKPILKSLVYPHREENMRIYHNAKLRKGRMIYDVNAERKEVYSPELRHGAFDCPAYINFYMEKIIELCLEENIPIYIEQMPMGNPGYNILVEHGYIADYQQYMRGLRDKYNIPVNDEIPVYPSKYFVDDSHLNENGAHKFTAEFRQKYQSVFDGE